ncbi:Glu/Leu/Phe/Val family dehydrogenase [Amphritea sp. HPY]|uniref:Glu/Leu/Phe/Val family dehydrogenase n=1 Tax=Amphritea sp. HPY TaxID=3421652 RepID=UPI003D7EE36E
MTESFHCCDELGPLKIIYIQNLRYQLQGILVVDNIAAGPAIGGLRMAPDVSTTECARLARAMTLKNAIAELPHGGAKSVLIGDPKMARAEKEQLIRAFASALANNTEYIFGPDMGTNEECMAWVHDEIGRAVGLPREIGGIPLDEIGATGWGVSHATEIALQYSDINLANATVAFQGFGAVGSHSARYLAEQGATIVAVSDSQGTVYCKEGLDLDLLTTLKQQGGSVIDYAAGEKLSADAIIDVHCDIWVPAARPDVINSENVDRLKARLVVQGANIPFTRDAEMTLHQRGVLVIPDFIANAGGVICGSMEYSHLGQESAFEAIREKIRHNTGEMLKLAHAEAITPREAGERIAIARVKRAMSLQRRPGF